MGTVYNPLHRPFPLFFLGFGITTAYIPGIIGASISTGWLFLLIITPILFLYCELQLGVGFLFICYASLSLFWVEILNIAWFYLLQLITLSCVFCVGKNIKEDQLKAIFKGLSLGLGISSIVAIFQHFGFRTIYTLDDSSAGLFINPNIYSEISVVILVALVVFKLWWWIPVTLPGLVLVQSRAAYLALGVCLFVWFWKFNKYLATVSIIAVGFIGAYFYWSHFSLVSIQERFDIWLDTIQGFKIFGNGIGSYETMFPYYATHIDTEIARPRYAHNDLLNLIFEFGIGSILFLMVLFNAFRSNKSETIILLTICIISLFTYPMHIPVQAFIAFLVTGYLTANTSHNWNIWNNWGPSLFKRDTAEGFIKA